MKKYAIIVAAGSGTRMGGEIPKQFQLLKGKPLLWHCVKAFTTVYDDVRIILVLPENHLEKGELMIEEFPLHSIRITAGGETRFQSVKNGLRFVDDPSIVFVHDGVRCLLSKNLVHRCYQSAVETGTAIPAIVSKDSIRLLTEEGNEIFDRNKVMLVQTPQTFQSELLLPAFGVDYRDEFTDEATVVEAHGTKISLVEGEESNIKITRPVDLLIADKLLDEG